MFRWRSRSRRHSPHKVRPDAAAVALFSGNDLIATLIKPCVAAWQKATGAPAAVLRATFPPETGPGRNAAIDPWPMTVNRYDEENWHDSPAGPHGALIFTPMSALVAAGIVATNPNARTYLFARLAIEAPSPKNIRSFCPTPARAITRRLIRGADRS